METGEIKTGISLDAPKKHLIIPNLVNSITNTASLPANLAGIDLGSGDTTTFSYLEDQLVLHGHEVNLATFMDLDITLAFQVEPKAGETRRKKRNAVLYQAGNPYLDSLFMHEYGAQHDFAVANLVSHQIFNDLELSYLALQTCALLKDTGHYYVVDFHPNYIKYLIAEEPDKLSRVTQTEAEIYGNYNFDSGGSNAFFNRPINAHMTLYGSLGMKLAEFIPIGTKAIADSKPRYQILADRKIPMFYMLKLHIDPKLPLHFVRGVINKVSPRKHDTCLEMHDGEEFFIAKHPDWERLETGDYFILQDVAPRKLGEEMLGIMNYWVFKESGELRGGKYFYSKVI